MKILHYALGFPPYRSGGLTKFCVDLMVQQAKEGHTVAMIWPGQMGLVNKKVAIRRHKNIKLKGRDILSFEIINPLPISYDEGIADIAAFMLDSRKEVYDRLFAQLQPDVIHVHTLMGIHKSFFEVARKKNIRLVFTAHDFFPICPKVTMFRHGEICRHITDCTDCGACNITALSFRKIQILQSPFYRIVKDSDFVKRLRRRHRDNYLSEKISDDSEIEMQVVEKTEDYKKLRNYYLSILKMMDIIHYNSSITRNAYEAVFDLPHSCTIPISHIDVKDNRHEKKFMNNMLRIRYLGSQSGAKGFFLLKEALDTLWEKQQNFCLDIHFEPLEKRPYMRVHTRYTYRDLGEIFEKTDILVAPSIWFETFGFTVLEALSYGVPVVVSGNVGAKDILVNGSGIVVENITSQKLCKVLKCITSNKLEEMNRTIVKKQPIIQIEDISKQIEEVCYGW